MSAKTTYRLSIDLNALNHLGINLYSNIPAVVSEVVANAWDADATKVDIKINKKSGTVTIQDDGVGMSANDINNKYLRVGYAKRDDTGATTPVFKRHVMGRKGIGKLSLFSIADSVEVHSAVVKKPGAQLEKNAFRMSASAIKATIENGQGYYLPTAVAPDPSLSKGTKIILRDLKKSVALSEGFLRTRLARRFSVLGNEFNFAVEVNGKAIGTSDRSYFKKIEFLWYFGDEGEKAAVLCSKAKKKLKLSGVVNSEANYTISGWIGTFDERASIEEGNNSIVVLAWGKLAQEDLLKDLDEGGLFTKYLIGEIRADFLDADDLEDIATSDRQRLREDDPRFKALRQFVQSIVKKNIKLNWTDWRKEGAEKKAVENKAIKGWFESLGKDHKTYAREMFARIESLPTADQDVRRELYRQSILAFESLAFRRNLSALSQIQSVEELKRLTEVIGSMDELEAIRYYEIVKGRVEVLNKLDKMKNDTLEKVIQEHVFEHLWLLDPSWERASTDKGMEVKIGTEWKKVDKKLSNKEKDARLDIKYRTAAGKNIVIELKKYDRKVDVFELLKQIEKYRGALEKVLADQYPDEPQLIEFICLVGGAPIGAPKDKAIGMLRELGARYITYEDLLKQTRDSYRDYLDAEKKIAQMQELVSSI